jgi:hypothetical protein
MTLIDRACFERGCACYNERFDKDPVLVEERGKLDAQYNAGWNSALELAAYKLANDFKSAFGDDTLTSIAAYIKEMKK